MCKSTREWACLNVFALLCLWVTQIGCATRCGVSDTVSVLDARNGIYLVYRVSGTQEKQEFFEIYTSEPKFDSCGFSKRPPIAQEPYLRSNGLLRGIEFRDSRLSIFYTRDASNSIQPAAVRFSHNGSR